MESINEKIKRIRKQGGISQVEVAKAAGINQASYSNIEKGDTKSITIEVGKGIARALGIPFTDLFEIEPSRVNSEQLERFKEEIEDLKEKIKEKQYLIDVLKKEKIRMKQSLLVKLFSEYSKNISKIHSEFKNDVSEKAKTEREASIFLVDYKFDFDKKYYIHMGLITEIELQNHAVEMKSLYEYIPDLSD